MIDRIFKKNKNVEKTPKDMKQKTHVSLPKAKAKPLEIDPLREKAERRLLKSLVSDCVFHKNFEAYRRSQSGKPIYNSLDRLGYNQRDTTSVYEFPSLNTRWECVNVDSSPGSNAERENTVDRNRIIFLGNISHSANTLKDALEFIVKDTLDHETIQESTKTLLVEISERILIHLHLNDPSYIGNVQYDFGGTHAEIWEAHEWKIIRKHKRYSYWLKLCSYQLQEQEDCQSIEEFGSLLGSTKVYHALGEYKFHSTAAKEHLAKMLTKAIESSKANVPLTDPPIMADNALEDRINELEEENSNLRAEHDRLLEERDEILNELDELRSHAA